MQSKVVLITGGSSGIGKSIGVYLKSKGHLVYGTTRNLKNHSHFNAFPLLELDVRNTSTIIAAVNELIAKEGRIDVLVNNAGIGIMLLLLQVLWDCHIEAFTLLQRLL